MVVVKLLVLGFFVVLGAMHIDTANYKPFAPNGWAGIHQGAAIVFFAYIGFDAISTAAEETKNPQRNMPIGILGGPGDLHRDLRHRRHRGDRSRAVSAAQGGRPAGAGAGSGRPADRELDRGVRRRRLADGRPARLPVRPAAHLPGDGARRAAAAMGREDPPQVSNAAHHHGGHRPGRRRRGRSSWTRTRSTTSRTSGRCAAFAIVCVGVLVLRYKEPDRPRPFRVHVRLAGVRWRAPRRASTR